MIKFFERSWLRISTFEKPKRKNTLFRSKKMLEKIRECPCGHCGTEDGTVVAAHRNESKGMGIKSSDALVAALCYKCHTQLDQGKDLNREERRDMWNQAYIKTMQYMIENELIK